jgi:hypothetical protein
MKIIFVFKKSMLKHFFFNFKYLLLQKRMFKIFLDNWPYATHKKIFLCCVKTQKTQLNTNIIINKNKIPIYSKIHKKPKSVHLK